MDNNENNTGPSVNDVEVSKEISPEDLSKLIDSLRMAQPTNYKHRMQGRPGTAAPKPSKHWFNGELISKADFDKLSWDEIHASNNVIRKG